MNYLFLHALLGLYKYKLAEFLYSDSKSALAILVELSCYIVLDNFFTENLFILNILRDYFVTIY